MASIDYTCIGNIKSDLDINDTSYDKVLQRAVTGVSRAIDAMLNPDDDSNGGLLKSGKDEHLDIYESPMNWKIYLKFRPVISVQQINVTYYNTSYVLDPIFYIVKKNGIILRREIVGVQVLDIQYTAGYLIDWQNQDDVTKHNFPSDLELACRELVIERYNLRNSRGLQSETVGSWSRTFKQGIMDDPLIKQIIGKYGIPTL